MSVAARTGALEATTAARPEALVLTGSVARLRELPANLAVLGWYGLVTIVSLWPLLRAPGRTVSSVPLDPVFQATVLRQLSENLLAGDLARLYDGGFFYPAERTLAMSDSLIALQPIALPLHLLLGHPVLIANLLLVATFPLAAISADLLARLWSGSRLAGWIAGTAYAFAAYRFTHIGHLNLLQMWALPLAFLTLEHVLRSGSRRAAVGWGLVHVFIAGTAWNYLLILAILEPLYLGLRLLMAPERRLLVRRALRLALPAVVATALIAVLGLPYLQLRAEGYQRQEYDTFDFSARFVDYLTPAADGWLLGPLSSSWRPMTGPFERALSPGYAVLGIALVGLAVAVARRRRGHGAWWRSSVPWLGLGAGAFVLSLGPRLWSDTRWLESSVDDYLRLPFGFLDAVLPLESIRSPARFGVLVLLAVAILAGAAAARWWRLRMARQSSFLRTAAVGLLALLFVADYGVRLTTVPVFSAADAPHVYSWLASQPDGPVVEIPTNSPDRYLLASTIDGKPRLNGWSGFVPDVSAAVNRGLLLAGVTPEEDPYWIQEVRRLGARYLIVHTNDVSSRTEYVIARHRRAGLVELVAAFGGSHVYRLLAWDPVEVAGVGEGSR
jgi:hypothetical protein